MNLPHLAAQLTRDLHLDTPPVHISYRESPPVGVKEHPGSVPSACTFWADGRAGSFYAPLSKHDACEIGAFVMGMPPEGEVGKRLIATIGMFEEIEYVAKGEAPQIPHNATPPSYVHYGPLAEAPEAPTVVLIFTNPANAMVALEAASRGRAHPFDVPVTGRPACSVVPVVLNGKTAVAMSMGCAGFRQFTEVGQDKVLIAVRGDRLERFAGDVHQLAVANHMVAEEMAHRKAQSMARAKARA